MALQRAKWVAPPESGKAGEVAIGADQLAPGLGGEGRQVGVGPEISLRLDPLTQIAEDLPVAGPRCDEDAVRLGSKRSDEPSAAEVVSGEVNTRGWVRILITPLSTWSLRAKARFELRVSSSQLR